MRGNFVFVEEGVGGGLDGFFDTYGLGKAFDEVGFAGTKFALKSKDKGVGFEKGKVGLDNSLGQ